MKKSILAAMTITVFSVCSVGQAAHVTADGKEWMQLTDSTNISHDTMASNCSTATGACTSGSFEGWTWANNDDVASLFDWYIGTESGVTTPAPFPAGPYLSSKPGSAFAPDFLSDFAKTNEQTRFWESANGMTRDTHIVRVPFIGLTSTAFIASIVDWSGSSVADTARIQAGWITSRSSSKLGQWVYRDVSAVPLPAAVFMFAPALLGFLGFRRKVRA